MSVQIIKSENKTVTWRNGGQFNTIPEGTGNEELDKIIAAAGYSYDPKQDIFYSTLNPWQRDIGYCHLYDELAAPLGMIIDCEPIHFDYLEKKWMIGFWKGQYDLVTGAEIGVYTKAADLNFLGLLKGTYYECVSNSELLKMSYTLKKNGKPLFKREGKHWWLTGFKLGEFSEPSELTMDITITLHNIAMRDAFVNGLWKAGYPLDGFTRNGATVSFTFATPHTPPPITRTPSTDRIIQKKNELLCKTYQDITGASNNLRDKVKAIEEQAPKMYSKVLKIGKSKKIYEIFRSLLTLKPQERFVCP